MIRLWHDDVRPPPTEDDWIWCRTNKDAMYVLAAGGVGECSLDHDLGCEPDHPDGLLARGTSPDGDGLDLVRWMVETHRVPPTVVIHSWNQPRAKEMLLTFRDAGYTAVLKPFKA